MIIEIEIYQVKSDNLSDDLLYSSYNIEYISITIRPKHWNNVELKRIRVFYHVVQILYCRTHSG
jgi:hypothetical protein